MKTSKLFISFSNVKSTELIPDKEYSLDGNDVIIYTIYLPDFIELKSELSNYLNFKELKKAQRFYKDLDRDRYIIYRAITKFILAAYTKLNVENINFDYHLNQKPYLASHPSLHFNISHSQDFAAIAISRKKIGLDIEYMAEDFKFTDLLLDVFENEEILAIQNADNKKHAFYTSWTRKEAFVKALGKGIDEDFKYIPSLDGEHSIDPILAKNIEKWQLYSFNLAVDYLGAVAFEGLSRISKNLRIFSIPNTMKDLLMMVQK